MTMSEIDEAATMIKTAADADAKIIFGATIDNSLVDQIKITVIATGFDENRRRLSELRFERPAVVTPQSQYSSPRQSQTIPITPTPQSPVDDQGVSDDTKTPQITDLPSEEFSDELDIPSFLRKKH